MALQDVDAQWSEADYLGLTLKRYAPTAGKPNPGVHATVDLLDAVYDPVTKDPVVLASYTFAAEGFTFLTPGEGGRFSTVFNAATWLTPVPEPATWVLMVIGLGVLGFGARRRKG